MLFENYFLMRASVPETMQTIMEGLIKTLHLTQLRDLIKFRVVETIISGFYNHSSLFQKIIPIEVYTSLVSYLIYAPK